MFLVRIAVGLAITFLMLNGPVMTALYANGLFGFERPLIVGPGGEDGAALNSPFEDLRTGRENLVIERLAPEIPREQGAAQVRQMRAMVPADFKSTRLVEWRRTNATSGQSLFGLHDHEFANHLVRSETVLQRATGSDPWQIRSFHIDVVQPGQLNSPYQGLIDGGPAAWAGAIGAALVPLFIVSVAWAVLLWRGLKHRWLWLLLCLVSVGALSVNLATGAYSVSAFMIQLNLGSGGASWSGSPFDAWMVKISAPIGAAIAWFNLGLPRE